MTPQQELEDRILRLRATHEAAEAVIKVWKGAPSHVSFGRFMEDALGKLDAAVSRS